MKWYRYLYMGERARKKRYKIIWKVRHNAVTCNVYLLTFPTNGANLLDIISAKYLLQPYYRRQDIKIIGIALSYEEAIELLLKIIDDVYKATGTVNIKEYIVMKQNTNSGTLWQV